jgi:hypothetical protein
MCTYNNNTMETYALYTRVYLNSYTEQYETIVTIDRLPPIESPTLRNLARYIHLPALSPFQPRGKYACSNTSPTYALLSLNPVGQQTYMNPAELPQLFSVLGAEGYVVDTALTRMLNEGPMRGWASAPDDQVSGELICYITRTLGSPPRRDPPAPTVAPCVHPEPHAGVSMQMFPPGTVTTTTTTTVTRVPESEPKPSWISDLK